MPMNQIQKTIVLVLAATLLWNQGRSPPKNNHSNAILPATAAIASLSPEALDYYQEIAHNSEYGGGTGIRRWRSPLRIKIHGSPTSEDREALNQVIQDLKDLTPLEIDIVGDRQNIDIHFEPTSQFPKLLHEYVPGNQGFAWIEWGEDGAIVRSTILIGSEEPDQAVRSHLIREELTQSLGLLQDSDRYPDSIFFKGWTTTQKFSDLDRQIISLHYQEIKE